MSKKKIVIIVVVIAIVAIVIIAAIAVSGPKFFPSDTIDNNEKTDDSDSEPNDTGPTNPPTDQTTNPTTNASTATATANTTVYFIDVGQGDAELIKTSDGKNILIDAGPPSAGSTVVSFLRSHNATTLDAFVATHPDADHIGGGDDVLSACTVRSVYQSGITADTKTYTNFEAAVSSESCSAYSDAQLNPGDYLNVGSNVTFKIMAINANAEKANDASLVIKMTDGTVDFLFTGDAPSTVESKMDRAFGSAMDIEILKVGHHGSSSSTSTSFLTYTSPAVAIIEVGADNSYGHPTQEALDRLNASGARIYRTDLNGLITITTDGTAWMVSTDH